MEFCLIICLLVGSSKYTCRVLTVSLLHKKVSNMCERTENAKSIYDAVLEPSYKKSTTINATVEKTEKNTPCHILTL